MYKRKVSTDNKKQIKIKAKILGINSLIHFGKYQYLTIQQILDRDKQYIIWCIDKNLMIPNQELKNIISDMKIIKK